MYKRQVYGGSITAILINTPGTANAAATCLDGYPMAQRGQPDRAISISTSASCFGGLFGSFCLLFTAPLLASVSIKFGVAEYFALGIFGLSIVTGVSSKSMIKGVMGAILGLLMGTVGIDTLSATFRYTFNVTYLVAGIAFVPLLIEMCIRDSCGDASFIQAGPAHVAILDAQRFQPCLPRSFRSQISAGPSTQYDQIIIHNSPPSLC